MNLNIKLYIIRILNVSICVIIYLKNNYKRLLNLTLLSD